MITKWLVINWVRLCSHFRLLFSLPNSQINCMAARHRNLNQFAILFSRSYFQSIGFPVDPHYMQSPQNKLLLDQWFTAVRALFLSFLCCFFINFISIWFFVVFQCKRTQTFTKMNIKGHFLYVLDVFFLLLILNTKVINWHLVTHHGEVVVIFFLVGGVSSFSMCCCMAEIWDFIYDFGQRS